LANFGHNGEDSPNLNLNQLGFLWISLETKRPKCPSLSHQKDNITPPFFGLYNRDSFTILGWLYTLKITPNLFVSKLKTVELQEGKNRGKFLLKAKLVHHQQSSRSKLYLTTFFHHQSLFS